MKKIFLIFFLFLYLSSTFFISKSQSVTSNLSDYKNLRFWDEQNGFCFFKQESSNACVSASIKMVFKYLDFLPLPSQSQLAEEMNSNINSTVKMKFTYIPFRNRGFFNYQNQSLADDFNQALNYLKNKVSQNCPVIVNSWFDNQTKSEGKITHSRVITGYNSTGIFFHDPLVKPNLYLNYSSFSNLWETDLGYWALIVEQKPKFNLIIEVEDWMGNPIQDVEFILTGIKNYTNVTDNEGRIKFTNLGIDEYVLSYEWRFQSQEDVITLTRPITKEYSFYLSDTTVFLIVIIALFGIIGYFFKIKKMN